MADEAIPWTCPYCGRPTTITYPNRATSRTHIEIDVSEYGEGIGIVCIAIACPSPTCKKLTLGVHLTEGKVSDVGYWSSKKLIQSWALLPESSAKPQPKYIPEPLREDYIQACRIADLSPKASATLSRRCLQGMIRHFWKTPKLPNLKQEIDAIQDKIDPDSWQAIDAVRNVGNIGAHMEHDINLIVEVDPQEAGLLIGLIETLFQEWYVASHERKERMAALVKLAADKAGDRKGKEALEAGAEAVPTEGDKPA